MPERDGKDQGEDSLNKASVLVMFARHSCISHKWLELESSARVLFADARLPISGIMSSYFCFHWILNLWRFVQSFFDMHAPPRAAATRSYLQSNIRVHSFESACFIE